MYNQSDTNWFPKDWFHAIETNHWLVRRLEKTTAKRILQDLHVTHYNDLHIFGNMLTATCQWQNESELALQLLYNNFPLLLGRGHDNSTLQGSTFSWDRFSG